MEKGNTSKHLIFIVLVVILMSVFSKVIVAEEDDETSGDSDDDSGDDSEKSDKKSPQESDLSFSDKKFMEGELDPSNPPGLESGDSIGYEGTTKLKLEAGILCFNTDYYKGQKEIDTDEKKAYVGKPFSVTKTYADNGDYNKINPFFSTDNNNEASISIPFLNPSIGYFNLHKGQENRELFFGYEGICRYYIKNDQYWYKTKEEQEKSGGDNPQIFSLEENDKLISKPYLGTAMLLKDKKYESIINWDEVDSHCLGKYIYESPKSLIRGYNENDYGNVLQYVFSEEDTNQIPPKIQNYISAIKYEDKKSSNDKILCCGDDYIWLKNKVINYEQNKQRISTGLINQIEENEDEEKTTADIIIDPYNDNKLCLYGSENIEVIDAETGAYRCSDNPFPRIQYQIGLGTKKLGTAKHIIRGSGKTDIGLYKLGNDKLPLYCNHYFSPDQGDVFEWITLDDAAKMISSRKPTDLSKIESENSIDLRQNPDYVFEDKQAPGDKDQFDPYIHNVCNFYLGGTWTGSRCCMEEFDYETMENKKITYYDEKPTHKSNFNGNMIDIPNGACVKSTYIDYAKPYNYKIENLDKDLFLGFYALKGKIYTCNAVQPFPPPEQPPIEEPIFTPERNYNICQAKRIAIDDTNKYISVCLPDSTFLVFNENNVQNTDELTDEEKSAIKKAVQLGHPAEELILPDSKAKNLELEDIPMSLSTAPWKQNTDADYSSCCFVNSCWDPEYKDDTSEEVGKCRAEGDNKQLEDGAFYVCKQGEWKEPTPKLNWYNDTIELELLKEDGSNLCTETFSCACPSKAYTDEDDNDLCDAVYTQPSASSFNLEDAAAAGIIKKTGGLSLCTNTEFYFNKDHLCEPIYADNQLVNAEWSSRTKLLAIQLLDIAAENDYTLHCGPAEQTLNNNPLPSNALIENAVNNFCILKIKDQTYIGVTINRYESQQNQDETSITFNPTELFSTFLKSNDYFDEDEANCKIEEDKSRYGLYKKCDGSNNIYYNNKLKAIIYNKNGINNAINDITENYGKFHNQLQSYKKMLVNLYTLQKNTDSFKSKQITGGEIVNKIADFNNLYIRKTANFMSPTIFAITERKWDVVQGHSGQDSLKYFTAIFYMNYDITGSLVNGIFNQNIDCNKIYQAATADTEIFCVTGGGLTLLFTQLTDAPYLRLNDVTSKLRLKQQLLPGLINPNLVITPSISPEIIAMLNPISNQ